MFPHFILVKLQGCSSGINICYCSMKQGLTLADKDKTSKLRFGLSIYSPNRYLDYLFGSAMVFKGPFQLK